MKKGLTLLWILFLGVMFLPMTVKAASYNTLNLKEALAAEEIEEAFTNYKPNKGAIKIYLFRGQGCGYCRAFLGFLNSITDEYGKYFELVSYEVWNDADNSALMEEVSNYLDNPAGGVPYIIIGDQVFAGYAEQYDEGIKDAIVTLYNTKEKDRYDVFTEMKKHPKKDANSGSGDINKVLILNVAFIALAAIILMAYTNVKFKEIGEKLDKLVVEKQKKDNTSKPQKNTKSKK